MNSNYLIYFTITCKFITLPGQIPVLHTRSSFISASVHLVQPYHACLTAFLVRIWLPPPQGVSHSVHSPQFEYSQFTTNIQNKIVCLHKYIKQKYPYIMKSNSVKKLGI